MKKGTKTWLLYYMIVVHILAVIATTGFVIWVSVYYTGLWNWLFLIVVSFINYFIFDCMFSYINRIIKRKNRIL